MRKLFFILLITICVSGLFAQTDVSSENSWILGEWRASPPGSSSAAGDVYKMEFNQNGTGKWHRYGRSFSESESLDITFSINGDTLTINFAGSPSSTRIFTYDRQGSRYLMLYGSNPARNAINRNYALSRY